MSKTQWVFAMAALFASMLASLKLVKPTATANIGRMPRSTPLNPRALNY